MAKQVLYSPVDISDGEYMDFEADPKAEAENAEFEKFKSEMHDSQDDAKITVGKKLTDSRGRPMGRQIFECFECGIDDYTFSQLCTRIREDFGTGLYQVIGRNSKGAYKFRKTVGILAPNTPDNPPAQQNDVGSLIDKFSDALQRQQMQTEELFSRFAGPRTGTDAIDQISKLAVAIGPILKVMGIGQPAPPPKTLVEQLTEFKMIKELFGGDDSGEYGEANLYSLLGETVKAFGGPIAQAIAAGAKAGDLDADGLATTGQLSLPKPETEQKVMQEKEKMEMRKNIHILIQNAKMKIPPASFALILVNNTPEDKQDALWDFISAENCIDEIMQLEPGAVPYRKWFIDLRDEVINLMADPESNDEQQDLTGDESGAQTPDTNAVAGVDDLKDSTASDTNSGDTPSDT